MSEGSVFKCPITRILKIEPHPGADRLDIATVYGFQVVCGKSQYKVGDLVVYIPIDSILTQELEALLFPKGSKITLHHRRIRQIRIRQFVSQGLLVDPIKVSVSHLPEETDVAELLGITKYEPPVKMSSTSSGPKLRDKPFTNKYFRCYNGITNLKWTINYFKDEEVIIQAKVHGTHVRAGKAPFVPNTLWKKIKHFFKLTPKFECVYGSNNVELTNRKNYVSFYGENIYGKCLEKYKVFDKIKDGEFIHGEIYGPGIQANYDYGATEHKLIIFDVRIMQEDGTQKWLNPEEAEQYAKERGFDFVPVLYRGIYNQEIVEKLTTGPDPMWPKHPREGCVIKSRYNYDNEQSKRVLKSINPDYLADYTNTDDH